VRDDLVLATADVKVAVVANGRPVRLPAELRTRMQKWPG